MPRDVVDQATKDPGAKLWYGLDLVNLIATGDGLASVAWTVVETTGEEDPPLLVVDDSRETDYAGSEVGSPLNQAWSRLTDGTAGLDYTLTATWTTDDGDVDVRSLRVRCRER